MTHISIAPRGHMETAQTQIVDTLDTDIGCFFSTIVLYHTKANFVVNGTHLYSNCILSVKPMGWIVSIKVDCQHSWGRLLKHISSLYRPESELFWSILLASTRCRHEPSKKSTAGHSRPTSETH